jgi:hypothetical protein
MKPGQIQVFDGLRLTTQHLQHLQGAFHSAVQDIRQILGLGLVHQGFEVVQDSDQTVTVMPGVAFDFLKNRIVSDEPRILEVKFGEGEIIKFVCVKYDQVEDGLVEGRATLIWDSCAIQLRPTLPDPAENEVPLCALTPKKAGGFTLVSLSQLVALQEGRREEAAPKEEKGELEAQEGEQGPEAGQPIVPEAEDPKDGRPEGEASIETVSIETMAGSEESPPLPAPSPTAPNPSPGRLAVAQGVMRLAVETGDHEMAILYESLQKMLVTGRTSPGGNEFRLNLATEELPLGFPAVSFSSQSILKGSILRNSGTPPGSRLYFQTTSQGEASVSADLIVQHAVSTMPSLCAGDGMAPLGEVDLTEAGIAHLTFNFTQKGESTVIVQEVLPILGHLSLLVSLERRENLGLQVANKLVWKGQPSSEILKAVKNVAFQLSWQTLIAWKVLGAYSL